MTLGECAVIGVAAVLLAGCYSDRLEHLETAIDSEGRLHVLVHRITAEDHGGGHAAVGFRHADETAEGWRSGSISSRARAVYSAESVYQTHVTSTGRQYAVVDAFDGVSVLTRDGSGPWAPVEIPEDTSPLGASWTGDGDRLWLLRGETLLELSPDGVENARATGAACSAVWECHFHPGGEAFGDAAIYDAAGGRGALRLQRLSCDEASCAWAEVTGGLGEPGGLQNDWTDRMFLHTALGTPTVIHRSGLGVRIGALGRSRVLDAQIYRFGAAPRPGGGLVVVTSEYYTDALSLHLVPDDLASPAHQIRLPTIELAGSVRLSIVVTSEAPERAHVVLSTGPGSLVHLEVVLETGAVSREDIDI